MNRPRKRITAVKVYDGKGRLIKTKPVKSRIDIYDPETREVIESQSITPAPNSETIYQLPSNGR